VTREEAQLARIAALTRLYFDALEPAPAQTYEEYLAETRAQEQRDRDRFTVASPPPPREWIDDDAAYQKLVGLGVLIEEGFEMTPEMLSEWVRENPPKVVL